ncbi:hypothetical protein GCM10023345_01710 [Acinetobacter kookii]
MGVELPLAKMAVSLSGVIEMAFGCSFLLWQRAVILHQLNIMGLAGLLGLIALTDPMQLSTAFNPVVMNIAMLVLSMLAIQLLNVSKQQA